MDLKERFVAAVKATPVGYFMSILSQRNPGSAGQTGSVFDVDQTFESLIGVSKVEPYDAGAMALGICTYVRLPIPGKIGIVSLDAVPPETELRLLDPKGTVGTEGGGVDAYLPAGLKSERVGFSVAILGPGYTNDKGGTVEVLWTIHPGDTVPRPTTVNEAGLVGRVVTPAEAKALGLTVAKF